MTSKALRSGSCSNTATARFGMTATLRGVDHPRDHGSPLARRAVASLAGRCKPAICDLNTKLVVSLSFPLASGRIGR
ncbi:hypothetical protein [Bradyrhizobium oligotrophicum]